MPKTKLSALLSLLLVFASGVLVGVVVHRLYAVNTVASVGSVQPKQARPDPEEVRRRIVADMRERVKLDDAQVSKLNQIYDDTHKKFDELHKRGSEESRAIWEQQKQEVKALLRPEQVPAYEQLQKERDEQRKRRQAEGKK